MGCVFVWKCGRSCFQRTGIISTLVAERYHFNFYTDKCNQVASSPMQIILDQNHITRTCKLFIHPIFTRGKYYLFYIVTVVVKVQNSVAFSYISVGQPNCTYQCRSFQWTLSSSENNDWLSSAVYN